MNLWSESQVLTELIKLFLLLNFPFLPMEILLEWLGILSHLRWRFLWLLMGLFFEELGLCQNLRLLGVCLWWRSYRRNFSRVNRCDRSCSNHWWSLLLYNISRLIYRSDLLLIIVTLYLFLFLFLVMLLFFALWLMRLFDFLVLFILSILLVLAVRCCLG